MGDEDGRTVWAGNLSDQVTEEILHELFIQAGPLQYIRHPKDKTTGKKKNFAFVCYRHECSVPYAIALLNEIRLFGRNIRVQSRQLQELQAQGLASYEPGGIHTLSPFEDESPSRTVPQGCRQQAPLLEQPSSLLGNVPPHIIALAQQQMAMLNAHQPMPLSMNPSLNARMRPRDDRYGSINYGRNNPSYGGYSHGSTNYDRNGPNSGGQSHQGYNRHQDNRSRRPPRHDNQTMQAMKSRFEDNVSQNSHMLAAVQDRQGRFDVNRLGSRANNYDNRYQQDRDDHHRSSNRDYRQQPYDRHESQHSRTQERHSSYDSHRRYDDKSSSSHRSSNDRYDRGHRNSSYDSRR